MTPDKATSFDEGNICPVCQQRIVKDESIISCKKCGSLHHASCWESAGGCRSYYCDPSCTASTPILTPDITITAEDARAVPQQALPPKRKSPEQAARDFLPPRKERLSLMALIAFLISLISGLVFPGFILKIRFIVLLGAVVASFGIVLGIIASMLVWSNRRLKGFSLSITAVLASSAMIIMAMYSLSSGYKSGMTSPLSFYDIESQRPTKETLDILSPGIARALRNNVVIQRKNVLRGMTGAGIILNIRDNAAVILTNKHVIEGKGNLTVFFYNGEISAATVLWEGTGDIDLALIQCQALTQKDFEPTIFRRDLALQGSEVFAVGNPLNLCWSYTTGVISSIRENELSGEPIYIYQTQTPINMGNSGGGLYNRNAELLGVNTWTQDKSVAEGISFSIATASILKILEDADMAHHIENVVGELETPASEDNEE
ncbi:trypsin-like peptidase domain-containing protein [Candidatus Sumerlaeota bacterium]|nr:trypsin-like peptidase domain-containing protein [Candidatus Sumerlaeota bacterium]